MQVDLETDLNRRRALQRVEELRAQDVSIASVRAEAMVKEVGQGGNAAAAVEAGIVEAAHAGLQRGLEHHFQ